MKVALTGGIGSGKTTVTNFFAELKVPIIDADVIAKQLLEESIELKNSIVNQFGSVVVDDHQQLDRLRLRKYIFSNPQARLWLERLLHPHILDFIKERVEQINYFYYIVAIPLLVEAGLQRLFEQVIVVDVAKDVQQQRVMQRDQQSLMDVEAIIASQTSRVERLHYATYIIDNSCSIDYLKKQVLAIHQELLQRYTID